MTLALLARNGGSVFATATLRGSGAGGGAAPAAPGAGSGAAAASASARAGAGAARPPKLFTYEVVREFHHDPAAFTQGLLFYAGAASYRGAAGGDRRAGVLYESTGLYGQTSVRALDAETGAVLGENRAGSEPITLDAENEMNAMGNFGEGLALVEAAGGNATLLQLTWH